MKVGRFDDLRDLCVVCQRCFDVCQQCFDVDGVLSTGPGAAPISCVGPFGKAWVTAGGAS